MGISERGGIIGDRPRYLSNIELIYLDLLTPPVAAWITKVIEVRNEYFDKYQKESAHWRTEAVSYYEHIDKLSAEKRAANNRIAFLEERIAELEREKWSRNCE